MSNYLYNGVELPALPEWDKTLYPYAVLWTETVNSSGALSGIYVFACDHPVIYDPTTYKISSTVGAKYYAIRKLYAFNGTEKEWQNTGEGTLSGNYATLGPSYGGYTKTLIWSNHDVYDPSGNLYLTASDPVPVEPEAPVLSWNGKDAYCVINGAWVKCDALRSTDGKWVKQDSYS